MTKIKKTTPNDNDIKHLKLSQIAIKNVKMENRLAVS